MAASYRSRFLSIMRSLEREMIALFAGLSALAARELASRADVNGNIPTGAIYSLQQVIGGAAAALFVGRIGEGLQAPFTELPDGRIWPMSPYSRVLFKHIEQMESLAIEQQRAVALRLAGDTSGQLQRTVLFRPNPLAQYEQAHTWVDPNGHTLSDRIWRTTSNTRQKLDMFLDDRIRQGQGALRMSRDLERFLLPGRTLRTKRPYGTDASYDAMRLARTEITRAHAKAAENAASLNPFVETMSIRLSGSHPKTDICDRGVAASPFPKDDIPEQYQIPMHPHCLCTYQFGTVNNPKAVMNQLAGVA